MMENTGRTGRPYRRFQRVIAFAAGAYSASIVIYLALRLLFGDGLWWLSAINGFVHLLFLPLVVLLPLALLSGKRNLLRVLPMVALAAIWFAPYYLPKSPPAPTGTVLKIVTFNVLGDNRQLETVENWLRETESDVVLLQDIPNIYSDNGVTALADLYPHQFVQGRNVRVSGNAILSRFPFQTAENIDLEGDGTPSHQQVSIMLDGQTISILNVHLLMPLSDEPRFQSPINHPAFHRLLRYDDSARNFQIAQLSERVRGNTGGLIVGGDFNLSDQSVVYQQFAVLLTDSFREAGSGLGLSWPLGSPIGLPAFVPRLLRIDYIWHSEHFRAIDAHQAPPLGSDHLGLVAALEITDVEISARG